MPRTFTDGSSASQRERSWLHLLYPGVELFRDECLNVHWFEAIDGAKVKIEAWRIEYNESRPHEALDELTPDEYALKYRAIEAIELRQKAEI